MLENGLPPESKHRATPIPYVARVVLHCRKTNWAKNKSIFSPFPGSVNIPEQRQVDLADAVAPRVWVAQNKDISSNSLCADSVEKDEQFFLDILPSGSTTDTTLRTWTIDSRSRSNSWAAVFYGIDETSGVLVCFMPDIDLYILFLPDRQMVGVLLFPQENLITVELNSAVFCGQSRFLHSALPSSSSFLSRFNIFTANRNNRKVFFLFFFLFFFLSFINKPSTSTFLSLRKHKSL